LNEIYLIKEKILKHLSFLINIDSDQMATIIINYFTDEHNRVLTLLDEFPYIQFIYLKSIVGIFLFFSNSF
jgi:hypothetical protein